MKENMKNNLLLKECNFILHTNIKYLYFVRQYGKKVLKVL